MCRPVVCVCVCVCVPLLSVLFAAQLTSTGSCQSVFMDVTSTPTYAQARVLFTAKVALDNVLAVSMALPPRPVHMPMTLVFSEAAMCKFDFYSKSSWGTACVLCMTPKLGAAPAYLGASMQCTALSDGIARYNKRWVWKTVWFTNSTPRFRLGELDSQFNWRFMDCRRSAVAGLASLKGQTSRLPQPLNHHRVCFVLPSVDAACRFAYISCSSNAGRWLNWRSLRREIVRIQ